MINHLKRIPCRACLFLSRPRGSAEGSAEVNGCAKIVSRLLNVDQKECRMLVSQDIIVGLQTESDLPIRVITGDERWIFEYNPKTKRQRSLCKSPTSPRRKKARQSKLKVKILMMLMMFFNVRSIFYN